MKGIEDSKMFKSRSLNRIICVQVEIDRKCETNPKNKLKYFVDKLRITLSLILNSEIHCN